MTTSSSDLSPVAAGAVGPDLQPRAPKRLVAGLAIANFGLWLAFFTPIIITLQLKVAYLAPGRKEVALAIVLALSSILGIIVTPLAGRFSDRTTSRFGMRRPWLLTAVLVGFSGLAIEAFSTNITMLTVGSALSQVGNSACLAVLFTLVPDHVPPRQRATVGSVLGLSQAVSIVFGVGIGSALAARSTAAAFLVPGIIGVLAVGVLCLLLRDRTLAKADVHPFSGSELLRSYWFSPRRNPDFGWTWLSRFLLNLGLATVTNYQIYFLAAQLHVPLRGTAALVGIATLLETVVLVICNLIAGPVSDRIGRRRPFVMGAALIGVVGLVVLATATSMPAYFLAVALVGAAQGIYYAVDVALVTEVLPNRERDAAKDLGLFTISNQLPQTLAPAIAPLFLAVGFGSVVGAASGGNYTALFVGSGVFALLSGIAITRVKGVR